MAARMGKNSFECALDLGSSMISKKNCEKVYKLTALLQGARDLCEEYIAARVWPLRKEWSFWRFHEKDVGKKKYKYPDFDIFGLKSIILMQSLFVLLR